jgi:hypothetical protein
MARKARTVRPVGPEEIDEVEETRKALKQQGEALHCRLCGVTEIETTYGSRHDGTKIDESAILADTIYAMVDLLSETQDELLRQGEAQMTRIRARALHGLVEMWIARTEAE